MQYIIIKDYLTWPPRRGHHLITSGDLPADNDEHIIYSLLIYLGFKQFSISRLIPGLKQWSIREFDRFPPPVYA